MNYLNMCRRGFCSRLPARQVEAMAPDMGLFAIAWWRSLLVEVVMQKKLTLSIDAEIYEALHKPGGKRKIGRFIENLVRPHLASLEVFGAADQPVSDEEPESVVLPWVTTHGAEADKEAF